MEARLLIVLAAAVLLRVPFLDQSVQGDEVYYLAMARNAVADPLHPMAMSYTFQGARVSMQGFPHPPLNAWVLSGLLRVFGEVRETAFHAVYALFSVASVWAMWVLGRRFTERPVLAAALFATTPAWLVNGNTLEADLPFLACWMAGFALYIQGKHLSAAGALGLAALGAYQAIFAAPILAHHVWHRRRRSRTAWVAVAAAPAALAAWQLFEWATAGQLPGATLAGYLGTYGLLGVVKKLRSAVALAAHLGWPAMGPGTLVGIWWPNGLLIACLGMGVVILLWWVVALRKFRSSEDGFLAAWGLVFFAGAAVVFYAGSARYLLPLAPAVALTLVRMAPPWFLWPVAAGNLAVGLVLAAGNYDHAAQYRRFAEQVKSVAGERRLLFHAEWGLRHYLEQIGGEAIERDQVVHSGAVVVTSELAGPLRYFGASSREIAQAELVSRAPARLVGLGTRSGYSSSDLGLLPFEPGRGVLDRVNVKLIGAAEPRLSYLRMNDPEAAEQLLSGFYQLESNTWRWMSDEATVLLKAPEAPSRFEMTFFIPEAAPARRVTVSTGGRVVVSQSYAAPGRYTLSAALAARAGESAPVTVAVDKSFRPAGDERKLGIIVQELGLR